MLDMFERATVFSAILSFLFFGMLGSKYLDFLAAKSAASQHPSTSVSTSK